MNSCDDNVPRGDLVEAMKHMAACNARLCTIAEAADGLEEAGERVLNIFVPPYTPAVQALANALDHFKIIRNGQ